MWRFSAHDALDGRGGLIASSRWHTRGHEIIYCGPNPSTAVLEVFVHGGVREPSAVARHQFLKLEIPDDVEREEVAEGQLPPDWSRRIGVTRSWGDRWLREAKTAVLMVRSVLVPETYNSLINPQHPEARRIARVASFPYPLDKRLVGVN